MTLANNSRTVSRVLPRRRLESRTEEKSASSEIFEMPDSISEEDNAALKTKLAQGRHSVAKIQKLTLIGRMKSSLDS